MKKLLPTFIIVFFLAGITIAQTLVPLPPHNNNFISNTRGYWFTAPRDFTITSIRVPTDASTDPQSAAIIKFAATPVVFPSTTMDYTTEALFQNVAGTAPIPVNIQVKAGEIIGILGSRGTPASNSYSTPNAPFSSDILGEPIELRRMGIQANLATSWPFGVFAEASGNISRVEITVKAPAPPIPTMSQWGLLVFGLVILNLGVVFVQRKVQI